MRLAALVVAASFSLLACNGSTGPEAPNHPGEDTGGMGMRLHLSPTDSQARSAELRTVKSALQQTDAGLPADTYVCVCPPPNAGDTSYTRFCECQVEGGGPELPSVCGDSIWNKETENCDPGVANSCPSGTHCNTGGEKQPGSDEAFPACFNCVANQ